MRAGKIKAHDRGGQGKIAARALTPLRAGPIGDTGANKHTADMFVDPFPYLSLTGLEMNRQRDPRGNIMRASDESHIQSRTRGRRSSRPPDGRSHHNGKLVTKE